MFLVLRSWMKKHDKSTSNKWSLESLDSSKVGSLGMFLLLLPSQAKKVEKKLAQGWRPFKSSEKIVINHNHKFFQISNFNSVNFDFFSKDSLDSEKKTYRSKLTPCYPAWGIFKAGFTRCDDSNVCWKYFEIPTERST